MKRPAARKSAQGAGKRRPDAVEAETEAGLEASPAATASSARPEPLASPGVHVGIQVEPAAPAARLHGRHDFMIRGRVVATARVAGLLLLSDGGRVGQLTYGRAETASQFVLPDGTGAIQHNFVFQLPSQHAEDATRVGFAIVARTDDDQGVQSAFEIEIDPEDPARAAVVTGPVEAGSSTTGIVPAIILYAEHATIDTDGNLRVGGWAVSQEILVGIQISIDDHPVGPAVLGGVREDVASIHATYANARNSGFSLAAPVGGLASGAKNVRIQATTLAGSSLETALPIELVERPDVIVPVPAPAAPPVAEDIMAAPDPRREISLYCDEVTLGTDGILSVRGWAVCAVGIAGISVLLDGKLLGDAEIGQPRLDVGDKFRDIPAARFSGFRLRIKTLDEAVGTHVVTVVVRNGLDDVREHLQNILAKPIDRAAVATRSAPVPTPRQSSAGVRPAKTFAFRLESPTLAGGAMTQLVTGRLTLEGWVLGRSGIASVEVLLDDQLLGLAHYGLVRNDIAAGFSDWPESLRCGFAFHFSPRSLRDGEHVVSLRIEANDGSMHTESFRMTVAKGAANTDYAQIRRHIPAAEAALYADILRRLDWEPWFRVVLRDPDETAPDRIVRTLTSLQSQVYPRWRADLLGDTPALREIVAAMVADGRLGAEHVGFLGETAVSLEIAPGNRRAPATLAGVLTCGDQLGCDALAEFAVRSGLHQDAELLYADEVRENPATGQREAFFKPGFSPDLLLSTNYIGRPWFATPSLLARAGASPRSLRQLGEYDLLLRCAERADPSRIHALPRLLCERAAGTAEPPDIERRALTEAIARRGIDATIETGCLSGIWRAHRRVATRGKVSFIVPTAGVDDHVRACLTTLKHETAFHNIEIVVVDNVSSDAHNAPETKAWLRNMANIVLDLPDVFNWSRFSNEAAGAATGEFLLFLDDDTAVLEPGWLDAMMEHAQRPEVGIVGARLLYPDDKVQHAGLFLASPGSARFAFRFANADDPGYFGLALTQRNVLAVSGSCMLMRRDVFDALGGFDEAYAVGNGDLDFCLRAHDAGLLTVFTPHASLLHLEGASRVALPDGDDPARLTRGWQVGMAQGDPYFSPSLSPQFDDYRADDEPVRTITSRHPLFRADHIRRILAIKADDPGDFVTALPAIRRLKAHFPEARLSVLANPAVRSIAALEPAIDETIDFTFVATRTASGKREADPEELAALTARLAPHAFDLAIDLRKQPDTRPLLRCAGAGITAGFNHLGRFPWLDVALEWEGDRRLQPKRTHVADDLMHLVDAVATAAEDDPPGIAPEEVMTLRAETAIPARVRRFLAGTVVCVHAGAGSEMKQWPVGHFAALIDTLVSRNQVRVLLVGGEDEADIAAAVLEAVTPDERVMSQVGELAPDVLAAVIAGCALFVGNDSGLKHIAAALGVPTIGVHSGVVDPVEWAPQGHTAIAVARAMTCSPCYLTRLEDCPREFACMRGLAPAAVHRLCEMMLARQVPTPSKALPAATRQSPAPAEAAAPPEPAEPADRPARKPEKRARPKKSARPGASVPAMEPVPDEVGDD